MRRRTAPKRDAFDDAVRILAGRSHGQAELERKLKDRGHDRVAITSAFERLAELSYLEDDADIARRYAAELSRASGATPRLVRQKLATRGFSSEDAAVAVEQAFSEWDSKEAALHYVRNETDPDRAARRLARRGFGADVIGGVVRQLRSRKAED